MLNIERFPSKQMYPYLSLVERRVTEFYYNMNGRRYSVWLKLTIFITNWWEFIVSKFQKKTGLWTQMRIATQQLDVQTKSTLHNIGILNDYGNRTDAHNNQQM